MQAAILVYAFWRLYHVSNIIQLLIIYVVLLIEYYS